MPQLRKSLLAWYDEHRRDLPWRETRDPYRIWISEIMLQQTRVAAVLPRYENFLRRFPSVQQLASAKLESVLAEWSGLGYYHRARNLHAAARVIAQERGGKFPRNAEAWRNLPGIGRYTAAAIASIAFDEPVAVLDGNVERVLQRVTQRNHSNSEWWRLAQNLLDHGRPGDFNQAMMELGATVCVPGRPLCERCPIRRFCRTRGRGGEASAKPRQRKASLAYGLATRRGTVLLVQRAANESLMAGMWELPRVEALDPGGVLFRVRHSITTTDYAVTVVQRSAEDVQQGGWVRISRVNELPLTGLAKKILRKAKIIE